MTQGLNQFAMTAEKGQLTLDPNWDTLNCQVDNGQVADLVTAQAVLLATTTGAQLPVISITAVTDAIFGFVTYNTRTDSYAANKQVKIARRGDVMIMEASAAITRGALLEVLIAGNKVVTKTSGTTIGKALDIALADGDLIRVEILV
ncbi:MAG: hypothetical protein COB09_18865 [Thalassobium sp.]|nr:MAG: hypothetical protein COB09_18865 [Thalassobium sp.]